MIVKLSHAPNPDIKGGYRGETPKENNLKPKIIDLKDASLRCRAWISNNDLGAGNWTGGQVYEDGKKIALVSYNGKVWDMAEKEIEI